MTLALRPVGYEVKRAARHEGRRGASLATQEPAASPGVTVELWTFLDVERLSALSVRVDLAGEPPKARLEVGILNHATGLFDVVGPFRVGDVGAEEIVLTQEDLPSPAVAYVDPETRRITLRLVETHPDGRPEGREERAYLERVTFRPVYVGPTSGTGGTVRQQG